MTDQEALIAALQRDEGIPLPHRDPRKTFVPIPRPDPRTWIDRLPRIQNSRHIGETRGEIPPSLLLYLQGINPIRKHGDPLDLDPDKVQGWLSAPDLWEHEI